MNWGTLTHGDEVDCVSMSVAVLVFSISPCRSCRLAAVPMEDGDVDNVDGIIYLCHKSSGIYWSRLSVFRQDGTFVCERGPYSCEDGVVPHLPSCRVGRAGVNPVRQSLIPLATFPTETCSCQNPPLVGVEGNRVEACLVNEPPIRKPGIFSICKKNGSLPESWRRSPMFSRVSSKI
ncbi:hypothetical protein TNCT_724521 [Trichonephila clavata]|uniref:Uncharacterized protein n=1 Tax=Trichonephila clavata TaxID=2740835 RepID=A0A8X6JAL6_TRICU|nr:hypothetical protein TNCT_724521 [Trichonephila clavata]